MSFISRNHPQQTAVRGAVPELDDRRTTDETFNECRGLAGGRGFDLDPAATAESTRAPAFFTITEDGLAQRWFGRVWVNPPYSDCGAWVTKAQQEIGAGNCRLVAMLLPANRTEQKWWQDIIEWRRRLGLIDVYFLAGRRRFDRPGWEKPAKGDRPPFGLCLVVWSH